MGDAAISIGSGIGAFRWISCGFNIGLTIISSFEGEFKVRLLSSRTILCLIGVVWIGVIVGDIGLIIAGVRNDEATRALSEKCFVIEGRWGGLVLGDEGLERKFGGKVLEG